MVIESTVLEGFSEDLPDSQAMVLLESLRSLCSGAEYVIFISHLPKDLEKIAFNNLKNYQHVFGWQYGKLEFSDIKIIEFLKNIWSRSYGTPLYFVVSSYPFNGLSEIIEESICKLDKHISGIISVFTYQSPLKTEVPILAENFKKIILKGHDGETVDIYICRC